MIKLKRLPRGGDGWSAYGYTGSDAEYRVENRLSEWIVTVTGDNGRSTQGDLNSLAEARAFVDAYDSHPGHVGDLDRLDAGYNAASGVSSAREEERMREHRDLMREFGL